MTGSSRALRKSTGLRKSMNSVSDRGSETLKGIFAQALKINYINE